jgi:hypothetical protein
MLKMCGIDALTRIDHEDRGFERQGAQADSVGI